MTIYHTKWEHRAFYNNTNNTHTHARTHARTHTHMHAHTHTSDEGIGTAVKNSSAIFKQVRLEGGFERGGRIRVAECWRQIVPNRWASIRKDLSPNVFMFTRHKCILCKLKQTNHQCTAVGTYLCGHSTQNKLILGGKTSCILHACVWHNHGNSNFRLIHRLHYSGTPDEDYLAERPPWWATTCGAPWWERPPWW